MSLFIYYYLIFSSIRLISLLWNPLKTRCCTNYKFQKFLYFFQDHSWLVCNFLPQTLIQNFYTGCKMSDVIPADLDIMIEHDGGSADGCNLQKYDGTAEVSTVSIWRKACQACVHSQLFGIFSKQTWLKVLLSWYFIVKNTKWGHFLSNMVN